jgi:hypothetical protein
LRALLRTLVGCSLAIALATGCGNERPRVPEFAGGWNGSLHRDVPAGYFLLPSEVRLCTDRPGAIAVTDVTLEHSEGIRVDAFSTKPLIHPNAPAEQWPRHVDPDSEITRETLWDIGFVPGQATVNATCYSEAEEKALHGMPPDGALRTMAERPPNYLVGIQLLKETDGTARAAIIRVTYESAGKRYAHRVGFELVLCGIDVDDADCDFGSPEDYRW